MNWHQPLFRVLIDTSDGILKWQLKSFSPSWKITWDELNDGEASVYFEAALPYSSTEVNIQNRSEYQNQKI